MRVLHPSIVVAAIAMFVAVAPGHAQTGAPFEIVVTGGSHAGTYRLPEENMICMYTKSRKQFSAAYKDTDAKDAKKVSGAGINVFDADGAGPYKGEINVRFGDPGSDRPAAFSFFVPRDAPGPITYTRKGTSADAAFSSKAKDGSSIKMTAHCSSIMEF